VLDLVVSIATGVVVTVEAGEAAESCAKLT